MIQAICHIQTQTVNLKLSDPVTHMIQQIVRHLRVSQIQLYQIIISLPAFIPQAIIIVGIPIQIYKEPMQIRRILPVL